MNRKHLPVVGQRIQTGTGKKASTGTVTGLGKTPHPKFGTAISVNWDTGRPGAFFSNVSEWKVI